MLRTNQIQPTKDFFNHVLQDIDRHLEQLPEVMEVLKENRLTIELDAFGTTCLISKKI